MSENYGALRDEGEQDAYARLLSHAFISSAETAQEWIREAGAAEARVLRRRDEVVAGLLRLPMGQWFGGRSVRMAGIADVGTTPEVRGQGAATELMRAAVREMHAEGVPLSVLYAASYPLYRRVGYDLAGSVHETTVPLTSLSVDRGAPLRRVTDDDLPVMRALRTEQTCVRNGTLDRGEFMNARLFKHGKLEYEGFVVEQDGAIDGYAIFLQRRNGDHLEMLVSDMVARTPATVRRLLGLFADHKAQVKQARWFGATADPFVVLLDQDTYRQRLMDHWMLRIVDVPAALQARGYDASINETLHLEVEDDVIEANTGRWIVQVEGGRATVSEGGDGTLRLGVRGLAPLYSGFLSPRDLRLAGQLEADDEGCAAAGRVFAGAAPFMVQMF